MGVEKGVKGEVKHLQCRFLHALSVLSDDEVVDDILDVTVHEGGEVVDGVVDAVVSDASLRIVVGADLG